MSGLDVAAGAIACVTIALQSTRCVYRTVRELRDGPKSVQNFVFQCEALQDTLEAVESESRHWSNEQCSSPTFARFEHDMGKLSTNMVALQQKLQKLQPMKGAKGLWRHFKTFMTTDDLDEHRVMIQMYISRLNLHLNAINSTSGHKLQRGMADVQNAIQMADSEAAQRLEKFQWQQENSNQLIANQNRQIIEYMRMLSTPGLDRVLLPMGQLACSSTGAQLATAGQTNSCFEEFSSRDSEAATGVLKGDYTISHDNATNVRTGRSVSRTVASETKDGPIARGIERIAVFAQDLRSSGCQADTPNSDLFLDDLRQVLKTVLMSRTSNHSTAMWASCRQLRTLDDSLAPDSLALRRRTQDLKNRIIDSLSTSTTWRIQDDGTERMLAVSMATSMSLGKYGGMYVSTATQLFTSAGSISVMARTYWSPRAPTSHISSNSRTHHRSLSIFRTALQARQPQYNPKMERFTSRIDILPSSGKLDTALSIYIHQRQRPCGWETVVPVLLVRDKHSEVPRHPIVIRRGREFAPKASYDEYLNALDSLMVNQMIVIRGIRRGMSHFQYFQETTI